MASQHSLKIFCMSDSGLALGDRVRDEGEGVGGMNGVKIRIGWLGVGCATGLHGVQCHN